MTAGAWSGPGRGAAPRRSTVLRAVGTGRLCPDRTGDGGPGGELPQGGAGAGAAGPGGLRPFHVERLAADAVDAVRRAEQHRLGTTAAKAIKGTRYALLKHPARLKPSQAHRLALLRRENRALDRAYELKEYLATMSRAGQTRRGRASYSTSGWSGRRARALTPSSSWRARSASTRPGSSPTSTPA